MSSMIQSSCFSTHKNVFDTSPALLIQTDNYGERLYTVRSKWFYHVMDERHTFLRVTLSTVISKWEPRFLLSLISLRFADGVVSRDIQQTTTCWDMVTVSIINGCVFIAKGAIRCCNSSHLSCFLLPSPSHAAFKSQRSDLLEELAEMQKEGLPTSNQKDLMFQMWPVICVAYIHRGYS